MTDIILTKSVTICFPLRRPRLSRTSLLLRRFFYNAATMSGPCPSLSHEEYSNGVKFDKLETAIAICGAVDKTLAIMVEIGELARILSEGGRNN